MDHIVRLFTGAAIALALMQSCSPAVTQLRSGMQPMIGKDPLTLLVSGDERSMSADIDLKTLTWGDCLKDSLRRELGVEVSLIGSCMDDATFVTAKRTLQEDIVSYRPDIVFIMLGTNDAGMPGFGEMAFRENIGSFIDLLRKHAMFPVLLTSPKGREEYGPNYLLNMRIEGINKIIYWVGGDRQVPVIDIASIFEQIRRTDRTRFDSLFRSDMLFSVAGHHLIAALVMDDIEKAVRPLLAASPPSESSPDVEGSR